MCMSKQKKIILVFQSEIKSSDNPPLFCCEKTEVTSGEIEFAQYPLSKLGVVMLCDNGITVRGKTYSFDMLPITIKMEGEHATKYREIISEDIKINIQLKGEL